MPIYNNNKILGWTHEGRIFYPRLGVWKVVSYYTVLAHDYFEDKNGK